MKVEVFVKPVKPLSANEQRRLEQLEDVVVGNFKAFIQVGQALAEIRDRQLYRERSKTFEQYAKEIFDIARGTAYRYIAAAQVLENVSNWRQNDEGAEEIVGRLPINEAQVRPLARLRPEQQVAVWRAVVEYAGPNRKITARLVNKVVKQYVGETVTITVRNAQANMQAEQVSADFKETFNAFMDQVVKEKDAGYKTTPKTLIIRYVKSLLATLAEGDADQRTEEEALADPGFTGGSSCANKLERAGYRLFRGDPTSLNIKERAGGGWPKHSGPFASLREMHTALVVLLQDEKHLLG